MKNIEEQRLKIRILKESDFNAVVAIDELVYGHRREGYFRAKFDIAMHLINATDAGASQMSASLVAEYDDKVVGYIMGQVYLGEFGIPEDTACLDTIGVEEKFRSCGIGSLLVDEFAKNLKTAGVRKVYTLVEWNDWTLIRFFDSIQFQPADIINLELKL